MAYCEDYLELICKGIANTIVTDTDGKEINLDKGIELWAKQVEHIRTCTDGLLFFCGNGASATMAEHMSHDWFQNALVNTTTCSETSHITAISNDLSYEEVFSYRIKRILSSKDLLVGISSSGNSPNIVNAISSAHLNGAYTLSLSGMKRNNTIRSMADLNFYVPLDTYGEVESAHALILHMALDYFLDNYLRGRH